MSRKGTNLKLFIANRKKILNAMLQVWDILALQKLDFGMCISK